MGGIETDRSARNFGFAIGYMGGIQKEREMKKIYM
jgi:hypothetical protein